MLGGIGFNVNYVKPAAAWPKIYRLNIEFFESIDRHANPSRCFFFRQVTPNRELHFDVIISRHFPESPKEELIGLMEHRKKPRR
jgi:hypothetical protein